MTGSKFPYSIYYRKNEEDVEIFAVLDDRRDPKGTDTMLGILSTGESS